MTSAEGIEKFGFRRWYERQLIEGHVYLVTCVLSLIAIAVCLEQIDWRAPAGRTVFLVSVLIAGGVLCVASLRRYHFLLLRAESLGEQSSCAQCRTYGVLKVLRAGEDEDRTEGSPAEADVAWIRVRCQRCGHEWRMENH
jgi:hypothetical protein